MKNRFNLFQYLKLNWIKITIVIGAIASLIYIIDEASPKISKLYYYIFPKEQQLFITNNFRVLILPFNQYGCQEGNDCGEIVTKRLTDLNLRDSLNIEVRFKKSEIDANFNKDKAEELQKFYNSDIVIYGSRFSNECNIQNDDEVCVNYKTNRQNLPISTEYFLSDPKLATLNDLWNGKLQGNIDFIIYWITGINELSKGNYGRAKKRAEYILENITQKNTDAFNFAALCCWLINNNQQAFYYSNRALEIDSTHIGALNIRGSVKYENHQYQEAIRDFDRAIELNPNDGTSYMNRANSKDDLGYHSEAILDYNKAIELLPDYYLVYLNRGVAKNRIGDFKGALIDYNKSIELNPNNSQAYFDRAGSYYKLGEIKKAIKELDKAIKLNPNDALAYNTRGVRKIFIKDYHAAITDFNEAITIDSTFVEAYSNRAEAYLKKLHDTISALLDYNKVIELDSCNANAYYFRASINFRTKKSKITTIISDLNRSIKCGSNFTGAYNLRGFLFAHQKRYNEALNDFNIAIKLDSSNAQAYYSRGILMDLLGNKEEAKKDIRKAKVLGYSH